MFDLWRNYSSPYRQWMKIMNIYLIKLNEKVKKETVTN